MWRVLLCLVIACKGDAPPPQPVAATPRLEVVSPAEPALVAVRVDDGGPWQVLGLRDHGYDLPSAARFTVVVVCAHWSSSQIEVRHWTADDNLDFAVACAGFDGESHADVRPAFAADGVVQKVTTGGIQELCSSNVRDCSLRTGTHDAIAVHGTSFDTMRARILRDLQVFDGLRFAADASGGWRPDRRTLEVVSAPRGRDRNTSIYVCLETRHRSSLLCSGQTYWGVFPERVEQAYVRVPDDARLATDCDVLDVQRTRMCLRDAPRTRVELQHRAVSPMRYDRTAHTLAFALADADALNVRVSGSEPRSATWNIIATRRWLRDAGAYALPALDTIPGWRAAWSRPAGEIIDGDLIWGPKPSSNRPRPQLYQRLRPGDRMDTAPAVVEGAAPS